MASGRRDEETAVECCCGADIVRIERARHLPALAAQELPKWKHVETGNVYCYPGEDGLPTDDERFLAEPADWSIRDAVPSAVPQTKDETDAGGVS
jgi:hypothetical protein